jgi:Uma2 family endonuclease
MLSQQSGKDAMAETSKTELVWPVPDDLRRQLLAALSEKTPAPVTYEQFLEWVDEDTVAKWKEGAIVMASPASARHQEVKTFLVRPLSGYVDVHQLGRIHDAPFQMKLAHFGREPDGPFVAASHLDRLKETFLDGPADLVVEIISPESVGRDRGDKFEEYREAGIPEYWLIDPRLDQATFYRLDTAGRYQDVVPNANGVYTSKALPGFWLKVDWLWQDPLPNPTTALLEIDRVDYASYLKDKLRQAGLADE